MHAVQPARFEKPASRAGRLWNFSFHRGGAFASFRALMLKNIARPLAVLALLASAALGDVVTLKNGEKVEGRVTNETPAAVTVEVKMAGGITDERVIKMTEVDKIDKAQPDEEAWAALKNLSVGDDSFDQESYERVIGFLKNFTTQFPKSTHLGEAQKKIAAFEEEKKRVDDGEMKLAGKWLTKDQVQEDRVQIEGRRKLALMKKQFAAGQLVPAMNTYSSFEKVADGSASYPEAILIARKVLPQLRTAAEARKAKIKEQADENKRRLANVQGTEKQQLETIQKQQAAQLDALVLAEERSGAKWLPLAPSNDKSISSTLSRINTELSSVNRQDPDKMRASVASAEKVKAALAANDVPTAEKALLEASSGWPQNELVKRLQPRVQEARVKAAEAAAKAATVAANNPAPTPPPIKLTPVTPTAAPEPVAEEPAKHEDESMFGKPAFWVILLLLCGGAAFVMKSFRKNKNTVNDVLDQ